MIDTPSSQAVTGKRVGFFITCLADFYRPSLGMAAATLLEQAGCTVIVPPQSCCGQPGYNSGDMASSRKIARQVIQNFAEFDYVVAPSGSCAAMLRHHYPTLFADDPYWHARASQLAQRSYELTSFLVDICHFSLDQATHRGRVTYHDSCSGLRELDVKAQPRQLLAGLPDVELREMERSDVCCGFGGTFCVKYPDISTKIVDEKTDSITATGADYLLAGDLGCLLNMAGRLKRQQSPVQVLHIAEFLAGDAAVPALGEAAPTQPKGE